MSAELADGFMYYFVFLLSTTLHEAGHAWAAKRGGDLTAYHGGQVSLSPVPHIRREPFGMVVLPLLSVVLSGWPFGFASAPYDPRWARQYPKRAGLMALAGPAANLLLVLIAAVLLRAGHASGLLYPPESITFGRIAGTDGAGLWPAAVFMLGAVFSLNLLLFAFNLLPFPPLDGSGALPLLLNDTMTRKYQDLIWGNPALGWIGLIVAWQVFGKLFQPIFTGAVSLLYPGISYR
jgi:Zn-dependent protease